MILVQLHDKKFAPYIPATEIQTIVARIGQQIQTDLVEDMPIVIGVLKGAFVFMADLIRAIQIPTEIAFIDVSSYVGMASTGKVSVNGLDKLDLRNRSVILVEDMIDTGNTVAHLLSLLKSKGTRQIKIACLLFKPSAFQANFEIDYIGKHIPNKFVVGYGLDYDELGRNLKEIYQLTD